MNVWVVAVLLLAVYCTVAEGVSCGGRYSDLACSRRSSYTTRQAYRSCHGWWRRRCNTRYRVVTKYWTTYYCNAGFRLTGSRCEIRGTSCGVNKYSNVGANDISPSIVGGHSARRNAFPWQVRLDLSGVVCGGTILNSTTILTAAHCVRGQSIGGIRVFAGDHDRTRIDSTEQMRTVRSVLPHPNFNPSAKYNDVALITLSTPLTLNANVRAACLPPKYLYVTNQAVVISGWGRLSSRGSIANILQFTVVRVVSHTVCRRFYPSFGPDVLCVSDGQGDRVHSSCFGDSGGPMVVKYGINWYVIGVTSYGSPRGCAIGVPVAYSSVMFHYDFILYGRVTRAAG